MADRGRPRAFRAEPRTSGRPSGAAAGFGGPLPVLRLVSLFTLLCMVPLALLTFMTIHLADRAVVGEVDARVRTASALTGEVVQQGLRGLVGLTESYAAGPLLTSALADGDPARFDRPAIDMQLIQLKAARPGIGAAFVADAGCRPVQVQPPVGALVGVDLSFRDWCQGVRKSGLPYVSEAYHTAIPGHPLAIAIAVPVRAAGGDEPRRQLGILVVLSTLDALRIFADQFERTQGVRLTITDQRGTLLVGPPSGADETSLVSTLGDARVRAALAGRSGSSRTRTADGEVLSAYAPIGTTGWTAISEVPAQEALAGVSRLRSTVLSLAGPLGVVLVGGILLLARTLRLRRKAERTLLEREADLAQARDQALEASRLKSQFLANTSHEIRSPMTVILGMNELLLETELDPTQRKFAEGVSRAGASLLGVISDILDFSKIEAGHLDLEITDVALWPLVEEVATLVSDTAEAKGLHLELDRRSERVDLVRGDEARLRQVLLNLVTNAVKFTEAGAVGIRLSHRADESGERACIEVVDSGIGVAPEDQALLFQPFSQVDASSTRRYRGTGLGLAICAQLVKAMGGTIGMTSTAGSGSTFWFEMPSVASPVPATEVHLQRS